MVFIVVFLNERPLEKQHLLKGYPFKYIKSNQINLLTIRGPAKSMPTCVRGGS